MEHGGHQGEGGVADEFTILPKRGRAVLTRLLEGAGSFYVKGEGNVLFVNFHFFPMRYRQVLKARRDQG